MHQAGGAGESNRGFAIIGTNTLGKTMARMVKDKTADFVAYCLDHLRVRASTSFPLHLPGHILARYFFSRTLPTSQALPREPARP